MWKKAGKGGQVNRETNAARKYTSTADGVNVSISHLVIVAVLLPPRTRPQDSVQKTLTCSVRRYFISILIHYKRMVFHTW